MARGLRNFWKLALAAALVSLDLGCIPSLFAQRQIERDMARVSVDIERIYQVNAETQKRLDSALKAIQNKQEADSSLMLRNLAEIEQRIAAMEEMLGKLQSQIEEIRYRTSGESPDRIPILVGSGASASTVVLEGRQMLLDGEKALARSDYEGARAAFKEFLQRFPTSPRAADAQMLIADSYYRQGKWEDAIREYGVVEQRYVASRRVPEAMMKTALCYEKMGRKDRAAAVLRKILEAFPEWDQIERVKTMLQRLVEVRAQIPPPPK